MASAEPPMDQNEVNMERQLTCSVCLELFQDPLLLPCLHSLCRLCVQGLIDGPRPGCTTHGIRCPECMSPVDMKVAGIKSLKRNFPLNNMVDIYKTSFRRGKNTKSKTHASKSKKRLIYQPPEGANSSSQMRETVNHVLPCTENAGGGHVSQEAGEGQQTTTRTTTAGSTLVQHPLTNNETTQNLPIPNPEMDASGQNTAITSHDEEPVTCCLCSQTKLADILCRTCEGIAFCNTCMSIHHPPEMGHDVMSLQMETQRETKSDKCLLCEGSSPSMAMVRCLECEITFCNECLHAFHPTTLTAPGHTLVDIRPVSDPRSDERETRERRSTDRAALDRLSSSSNQTIDVVETLAHLAVETSCVNCHGSTPNLATRECLTCETFLCKECAGQHMSSHPEHSVIDVSLVDDEEEETPQGSEEGTRVPEVQLKLIDLMNIRSEVMSELLCVLNARRELLESSWENS